MDMPGAPPRSRPLRDTLLAWEVLAVCLAATAIGWILASRQLSREASARFEGEVARLEFTLRSEFEKPVLALDAFRGLFNTPREVDAQIWKSFVTHIDVRRRFPGVRALGYAMAVRESEIPAFHAYTRRTLGGAVTPNPSRTDAATTPYFPVLFMEPELPRFRMGVLGRDLLFEPLRAEAVKRAIDTGQLAITAPLNLFGVEKDDSGHPGAVFYLPLYSAASAFDAEGARTPQGIVFGSLVVDKFLDNVFSRAREVEVRVVDRDAAWSGGPIYDSARGRPGRSSAWRLSRTLPLIIGQRTWLITYSTSPTFDLGLKEWAPTAVLIGGALLSVILFGFTRAQMRGRARAEAMARALQESEDRFRGLADTAACIIVLFSEVIEYVNDYACSLLGRTREQMVGQPLWTLVHADDREAVKRRGEARLRGEAVPERIEIRMLGAGGEERWVDFTAGMISWGGKTLAVATGFDITDRVHAVEERLRLERRVLESQRLESLGLLAGGIAHDFNNLLGAAMGSVALAEDDLPVDAPARTSLARLRDLNLQMAELSRQMLAYSGRGTLVVEPIDLSHHVRSISGLLEVSVPKKARITMDLAEGLPLVRADAGQIHQVVLALVTNAAEAIPGEGSIRLHTFGANLDRVRLDRMPLGRELEPGPYVCLEVGDDGVGMDEATLARVFDPFFSTKFAGRGLGLAALQGIVQGHGGAIEAESRPGGGSTFRVFLPPTATQPMAVVPRDTGPVALSDLPKGQGRILIAEDEDDLREVTAEVLRRAGYVVVEAADGGEAVERFAHNPELYDLAILDLTMPVLDGGECFRRLREIRPDLKVVLASGYGGVEAGTRFRDGDLAGFLQKPYRSRDLIDLIRKLLNPEGAA